MADFSGFEKESQGTMRRLVDIERKMRFMKEVLESDMGRCDALERENKEMKNKFQEYEHTLEDNMELKEEIGDMEKKKDLRKEKCGTYELQLEDPKEKVKDDSENIDKAFSENKLKELKSVWKKEREEENISFAEVIKKQIQDKTKDTVIQIVKEKEEDLVRKTVARRNVWLYTVYRKRKIHSGHTVS